MSNITLKNIYKIYEDKTVAVEDFCLEIKEGEFMVFVGPSGCGKSTTLRMIAGLEDISRGELYMGDRLMNSVAPKDKDIAMVFQNYALYPHMSVYKNMAFGLQLRRENKKEIDKKIHEAAKILDIEKYLARKPKALSGGQRQRVALGRAMVRNPSVFLLDEPLSNLDAKLRTSMRSEISKLHERLKTTFIYVTHDQTEAMTMGDRICVMKDGIIRQVDTPQNLYEKPRNLFVAGFIGSPQMNFLNVKIFEDSNGWFADYSGEKIRLPKEKTKNVLSKEENGKSAVLGIRPEHIHGEASFINAPTAHKLKATVELCEMLGSETDLYLSLGVEKIIAKFRNTVSIPQGSEIEITLDCNKIHLFDSETGETIFN